MKNKRRPLSQKEIDNMSIEDLKTGLANGTLRKVTMPYVKPGVKRGRNEPCPCKSGKKYKKCHGLGK